jgi:glycosyltransferase involved in cell wall biosynthesis
MAADTPTLTAIVPATNCPATLDRCLEAIKAGDDRPEETLVISEPASAGPAEARNAGAARARGEVLVFVDADVVVHADAIARIRRTFAAAPTLTALLGSYDDRPEAPDPVSGFRNLLHHHVHHSAPGAATTFWAGLGAVRRQAFETAGGFDQARYPRPSVEDIELGMRLAGNGGRIELDPRVQGTHLKRWTISEMVRTDFSRRGVPWLLLVLDSRGQSTALNLGWRNRLSAAASLLGVGALLSRRPRAAAAASIVLVALNRPFYSLLLRRRGAAQAAAGVALMVLHQLTAAASIPAALVMRVARRRRGTERYLDAG